jgi:PiT family inorganic phosphate transporter
MPPVLIVFVAIALAFDFLTGFHGSANIVATMISSRSLSPYQALLLSAAAYFAAPFMFGIAVANTIGQEVVQPYASTLSAVMAALAAAIVWELLTWLLSIPSSSSHALVGGLVGAVVAGFGSQAVRAAGLVKVVVALFLSAPVGLIAGYIVLKLVLFLARGSTPRINWLFTRGQRLTALALALSHGANDAQKTMGIITLGLVGAGALTEFHVPVWVILACAASISLGTAVGGWRIIRTLGGKYYRIRPVHGFSAQIAAAGVIFGAALLGGPVSTTQVVSSAILGVGTADRINQVRWTVVRDVVVGWVLTIPGAAVLGAAAYMLLGQGV